MGGTTANGGVAGAGGCRAVPGGCLRVGGGALQALCNWCAHSCQPGVLGACLHAGGARYVCVSVYKCVCVCTHPGLSRGGGGGECVCVCVCWLQGRENYSGDSGFGGGPGLPLSRGGVRGRVQRDMQLSNQNVLLLPDMLAPRMGLQVLGWGELRRGLFLIPLLPAPSNPSFLAAVLLVTVG